MKFVNVNVIVNFKKTDPHPFETDPKEDVLRR